MDKVSLNELLATQSNIIRAIFRTIPNLNKMGTKKITVPVLQNRLAILKENWAESQRLHVRIDNLVDDDTRKQHEYFTGDEYLAAEEAYFEASDSMCERLAQLTATGSTHRANEASNESATAEPQTMHVKLPQLEIPKFSGIYTCWESFRDLFESLVGKNAALSNVQRLQYLKASLTDEAALVIKNINVTNANYNAAWEALKTRYDNPRAIVNAHLHTFYNLPSVGNDILRDLKTLRDQGNDVVSSLTNLGRPVSHWDDLLVYFIVSKFDKQSRKDWETQLGEDTDYPKYEDLKKFLNTRIRTLEAITPSATSSTSSGSTKQKSHKQNETKSHLSTSSNKCLACDANHALFQCDTFKSKTVAERTAFAREKRCCFNCLSTGHLPRECPSKHVCRVCKRKHHSLIHSETKSSANETARGSQATPSLTESRGAINNAPPASPIGSASTSSHQASLISNHVNTTKGPPSILATAWARVRASSGRSAIVRVLIDPGSQSTFASESLVQMLHAPRQRTATRITGVGGETVGNARTAARLTIEACTQSETAIHIYALVLPNLSSYTPVRRESWEHLRGIEVADEQYDNKKPIQLLIGADNYGAVLLHGVRKGPLNAPIAQETIFGWVISGPSTRATVNALHTVVTSDQSDHNLDNMLKQFWEIEELPRKQLLTEEERLCEAQFVATHSRTPEGRYVVRLPFKSNPPIDLGASKHNATILFYKLERRLNQNPEQAKAYREFLSEYETLGHMQSVDPFEPSPKQEVYIPHHPVVRESSSTTKLRVVFNASSPTSNGKSLNDQLLIGPNLQIELPSIILRWRSFRYVYMADMAKMFRQIQVDSRDVDYQRILWRTEMNKPLRAYRLLTLTYGTASAPYLSNRVIQQLAIDEGNHYPLAVPVLKKHIYVDDVIFGADDLVLAQQTRLQVSALLKAGGFHLRKWMSNRRELLEDIQSGEHELASEHPLQEGEGLKVLGILWCPHEDAFRFKTSLPVRVEPTKRQILATISRIFDPLGWAAPVVISVKILMQTLWKVKCEWDETLPEDVQTIWHQYCSQLKYLDELSIPRWTGQGSSVASCEIHGFADASNAAYAAVVYLRVLTIFNEVQVSLLMSKTKVAPIKCLSVPRLELSAAALLARVVETVRTTMELPATPVYCWTDSTIVLAWLKKEPASLKTFVANRVLDVQSRLPKAKWQHVPTSQNPADCASRGVPASEFRSHPLWWKGPPWLRVPETRWPEEAPALDPNIDTEEKTAAHVTQNEFPPMFELSENISSWPRLLRVTAYLLRFVNLTRGLALRSGDLALTVDEINKAKIFWIKETQAYAFKQELQALKTGKERPSSGPLRLIDPFLDESGIIRVGGRLRRSQLLYENKFPIVLPKHRISELIVSQTHMRTLHGGVQITLRVLRQQFWIIGARNLVKSQIRNCVICVRQRATLGQQIMAELPSARITPARPFSRSGVDYAGPFLTRSTPGRGNKTKKTYIAIFVCLVTRAIHLELVSDYSSAAFLAAFDRFSSRRGIPSDMYSDNGTTFQGADKELTSALRSVTRDVEIRTRLASDGTAWHFQPPYAPHFGGIWEAGVKSVKHHLRRIVGSRTPTFEEFVTLLCQIEAVLNSRPIAPLTDGLEDFNALTPGHFLVGAPLKAVPAPSLLDVSENRLTRWQQGRKMLEQFWKVWSSDYLNSLQQRYKWSAKKPDVTVGELVLLRNATLPPAKWDLGRVIECHPGSDDLTRVVTVKTAQSIYKRPITKLCRLPVRAEESTAPN